MSGITRRRAAVKTGLTWMALSLTLLGCDLEPDVGPPIQERCDPTDSNPDVETSWSVDVASVLGRAQLGCVWCHDRESGGPGFAVSGLDLTSLETLRAGGARSGSNIIVAGDPCQSVLYQKLLAGPPFGSRMPLDGPPFLSNIEARVVHDWIAEGAKAN